MSFISEIEEAEAYLEGLKRKIPVIENRIVEFKEIHRKTNTRLTHAEAGRILNCSPKTVSRMLKDGRLESTRYHEVSNYSP